ncbi:MAG: S4 domain-containing protein, partial [Brevundimonas sp.]|nr:S4 domain-containing protein [Brevundimonas sp.]
DGETVLSVKPVMGYLHRSTEKLGEARTWVQAVTLTDRLDYLAPMSNNLAYALALEVDGAAARLEALDGAAINDAKKALADAATTLLHGAYAAERARETAESAFEKGVATDGLHTEDMPWGGTLEEQERNGGPLAERRAEALLKWSGLAPSIGQARKKIENEGVWINDELVRDPARPYALEDVDPELGAFRVRLGKRGQIVLVRPH